jgi:hypothetical protein
MRDFDEMKDDQNSWRQEKRIAIEKFFIPENLVIGSHVEHCSPSGKFLLAVDHYFTGPKTWQYSRGIVSEISNGKIIADVKRNIGHFWHSWVQHPNGKEYLLCGEDYQGYEVIELTGGKTEIHLPDSAKNGGGFCWAAVYPSKNGKVLAVEGCLWGGPYDLIFYDFSEPLNLPFPEIGRVKEIGEVIGWESETIFAVQNEFAVRKSDNRRFESLSESEQGEFDENASAFSYQTEILHWNSTTRTLVDPNQ